VSLIEEFRKIKAVNRLGQAYVDWMASVEAFAASLKDGADIVPKAEAVEQARKDLDDAYYAVAPRNQ
jgi:hypothetical protein